MADLFADVKVGDVVYYWEGAFSADRLRRSKVTRVTGARFECSGGTFRKSDGRIVGGNDWDRRKCYPATPELEAEYVAQQSVLRAKNALRFASEILLRATRDDAEAIRLAALLPPELKGTENG